MADVKVYSTPGCSTCRALKDFLKENGVEYEDINVAADLKASQEMIEKSGQMSVPVLDVKGKVLTGFNKKSVKEALGL